MKYTAEQIKHYTDIIEGLPASVQQDARRIISTNNPATVDKALNSLIEGLNGVDAVPVRPLDIIQVENDIQGIINKSCLKLGLDADTDLIKAPQRLFGAVCSDIGKYIRPMLISHASDENINIDYLKQLLPVFYDICNRYNKVALIDYLALFLGVSRQYLSGMQEKLTAEGFDLVQKREASLTAGAVDTPVGTIATLNHLHGWATNRTETTKQVETVVIYPKLVDIKQNQLEADKPQGL